MCLCSGWEVDFIPCPFTGPLSALYRDINIVHPSLLSCVEPLESQQVQELLRRLGVHQLEPQELLEQHIYPSIQNQQWKVPINITNTTLSLSLSTSHPPVPSLVPPPAKARGRGGELLGFHQAAFLLRPRWRLHCSTRPHQQGPAVPG